MVRGERWRGGGGGGMLPSVLFHLAELGQDGRVCSAGRKDSGHQGMLTEMHRGIGGQSDRSVPESAQYRIRLKSGVTFVYSGTMGNVHWHVRVFHFRKG